MTLKEASKPSSTIPPRGILPLRKVAAEIMLPKRCVIGADPADILITTGGLFYWIELPENALDTTKMTEHVDEFGVNYAPGAGFFVDGKGHNCMRLSFGSMSPEVITRGIKQLGDYIKAHMS